MKTPVFSIDGDDVKMFADAQTAETYFEAIDVIDEAFVMFDADGTRIKVSAESYNSPVVITDSPEPVREPEVLRTALRNRLMYGLARRPEFVPLSADEIAAASLPDSCERCRSAMTCSSPARSVLAFAAGSPPWTGVGTISWPNTKHRRNRLRG